MTLDYLRKIIRQRMLLNTSKKNLEDNFDRFTSPVDYNLDSF